MSTATDTGLADFRQLQVLVKELTGGELADDPTPRAIIHQMNVILATLQMKRIRAAELPVIQKMGKELLGIEFGDDIDLVAAKRQLDAAVAALRIQAAARKAKAGDETGDEATGGFDDAEAGAHQFSLAGDAPMAEQVSAADADKIVSANRKGNPSLFNGAK